MDRVHDILRHILKYCNDIIDSIDYFGDDIEIFKTNHHYQNDISMSILQIGELVSNHLPNEFLDKHSKEIPWQQIRGMRNRFAHNYVSMDYVRTFNTAHDDIPVLKSFCEQQLQMSQASSDEEESDENGFEP